MEQGASLAFHMWFYLGVIASFLKAVVTSNQSGRLQQGHKGYNVAFIMFRIDLFLPRMILFYIFNSSS